MPSTPEGETVSSERLLALLRADARRVVILDCRSSIEYGEAHIREAVNFSIPSIMLRRLAAGKIDLASTIKCRELKQKVCSAYKENLFVLYSDVAGAHHQLDSVLGVLLRRLAQDGCRVACLEDSFRTFQSSFPEWCESCSELLDNSGGTIPPSIGSDPLPLVGLRSLRISSVSPLHRPHRSCDSLSSTANSSTDSSDTDDRCDSSLGLEEDREFPVEIIPYLFLGNAANSEDSESLAKHNIEYILNVTPDLPNVFEDVGNIKYMQIPITDHWSQNLASHFPQAIDFIDEARTRKKGILVHCLAGVSRSVTITVAYLMYRCSLNLNDAFNVVRSRKSNIAPNFHFMEQLHNFERELKLDVSSQSPQTLMEQFCLEKYTITQQSLQQQQQQQQYIKQQSMLQQNTTIGHTSIKNRHSIKPKLKSICQNCGLICNKCKCQQQQQQHNEYLSPLGQIGVTPDSGIEFDKWTASTPGGE